MFAMAHFFQKFQIFLERWAHHFNKSLQQEWKMRDLYSDLKFFFCNICFMYNCGIHFERRSRFTIKKLFKPEDFDKFCLDLKPQQIKFPVEYRNESKFTPQFVKKYAPKFPLIIEGYNKHLAEKAFFDDLKENQKFEEKPANGLTKSEKELLQIYAEQIGDVELTKFYNCILYAFRKKHVKELHLEPVLKPFFDIYAQKKNQLLEEEGAKEAVIDFANFGKVLAGEDQAESENAGDQQFYHPTLYKPCSHFGKCSKECPCLVGHSYCEWYCACRDYCRFQYPGCRCKQSPCSSKICFCKQTSRECTPGICGHCFTELRSMLQYYKKELDKALRIRHGGKDIFQKLIDTVASMIHQKYIRAEERKPVQKKPSQNNEKEMITRRAKRVTAEIDDDDEIKEPEDKHEVFFCENAPLLFGVVNDLALSHSKIPNAGLGMFANKHLSRGQFIGEYVGAILSEEQANQKNILNDAAGHIYFFGTERSRVIDAHVYGNMIRYANHAKGKHCNAYVMLHFTNGVYRVGLWAQKEIQKGEEIYFDYGEEFGLKLKAFPPEKLDGPSAVVLEGAQIEHSGGDVVMEGYDE